MRSILSVAAFLATLLSCQPAAYTGVVGRKIAVTGARPCVADSPIHIWCSENLPKMACDDLEHAVHLLNHQLPGAMVYEGPTLARPGDGVTAAAHIVVGYVPEPVLRTSAPQVFMQTRFLVEPVTGCMQYTFIQVALKLDGMKRAHIALAFFHELLHAVGVGHTSLPNSAMYPGAHDFNGEPSMDPELADTLNALYPERRQGRLF